MCDKVSMGLHGAAPREFPAWPATVPSRRCPSQMGQHRLPIAVLPQLDHTQHR